MPFIPPMSDPSMIGSILNGQVQGPMGPMGSAAGPGTGTTGQQPNPTFGQRIGGMFQNPQFLTSLAAMLTATLGGKYGGYAGQGAIQQRNRMNEEEMQRQQLAAQEEYRKAQIENERQQNENQKKYWEDLARQRAEAENLRKQQLEEANLNKAVSVLVPRIKGEVDEGRIAQMAQSVAALYKVDAAKLSELAKAAVAALPREQEYWLNLETGDVAMNEAETQGWGKKRKYVGEQGLQALTRAQSIVPKPKEKTTSFQSEIVTAPGAQGPILANYNRDEGKYYTQDGQLIPNAKPYYKPEKPDKADQLSMSQQIAAIRGLANDYRIATGPSGELKDYLEIKSAYNKASALAATKSPTTDQALLVLFQKVLDPGSVVRESEFYRTLEAQGAIARVKSAYLKLMGGGMIDERTRADVLNTVRILYEASSKQYEPKYQAIRRQYEGFAQQFNLDPKLVIPDYGTGTDLSAQRSRLDSIRKNMQSSKTPNK